VSRKKKIVGGVVLLVLLLIPGLTYALSSGGSSANANEVVVLSTVQRRTLQGTVALTGTLARKSIRNVTAATSGLLSDVFASAGDTTQAGTAMFSLNGRQAIAEQGSLPFFRSLVPGDSGPDVTELKQILDASGDYAGPMSDMFTEQTQFALAQWQAQHGYPNSTPATSQSVTVSLEQGSGYKLGNQASAGLIIGPPANDTAKVSGAGRYVLYSHASVAPRDVPVITIQSVDEQVPQGEPANFVITASSAPSSNLTVNLASGGTAGANDIVTPPASVTIAAGATTTAVSVQTRVTNVVAANTDIVISISAGSGYSAGTPSSAQTTIVNNNVPTLQITGGATVSPGGSVTLVVTANQAPAQSTEVALSFSGTAISGTDYDVPDPVVTLTPQDTTASITVNTHNNNVIQPNKYIVVSISPSPSMYSVGSPGTAVITIGADTNTPIVTLTSATNYLQKGEPYVVMIGLSQAMSSPLTINLAYDGTAVEGIDYTIPSGNIVVPSGQTSLEVQIPTNTDNLVEANSVLTLSLLPSRLYTIGSPSTASVTITSSVVPELTISASASSVAAGGAASFTITANDAPVMDTSVNFAIQGTAQPGQNYQPLSGTALLKAGQTSVTVVLQSLQTNITFEPTDMIVGSWPTRVGQVFLKAGNPVAPGTAILSLAEQDLTVTLDASAANRTMLAVGQSCTVQINGETNEAQGVITELDSTPTVVASSTPGQASQQLYEGKIDAPDLNGADGSAVSISVVTEQETDAVTVPIAAVKQNGSGTDVVRVIDLARHGAVTEVPVTTGLSEGSYIEIKKGLQVGQTVVVQVNQAQ